MTHEKPFKPCAKVASMKFLWIWMLHATLVHIKPWSSPKPFVPRSYKGCKLVRKFASVRRKLNNNYSKKSNYARKNIFSNFEYVKRIKGRDLHLKTWKLKNFQNFEFFRQKTDFSEKFRISNLNSNIHSHGWLNLREPQKPLRTSRVRHRTLKRSLNIQIFKLRVKLKQNHNLPFSKTSGLTAPTLWTL